MGARNDAVEWCSWRDKELLNWREIILRLSVDKNTSVDESVEYLAVWIMVRRRAQSSTLKMEALYSLETSVTTYLSTRRISKKTLTFNNTALRTSYLLKQWVLYKQKCIIMFTSNKLHWDKHYFRFVIYINIALRLIISGDVFPLRPFPL
jgi:hypothetical protein